MPDLLPLQDLPPGFEYPPLFIRAVGLGLLGLEPWWILHGERLLQRAEGLRERYPDRRLVPFAERQDNDDVACWEGSSPEVVIVHDFASPGWEDSGGHPNFGAWLRQAIEDFIDWE